MYMVQFLHVLRQLIDSKQRELVEMIVLERGERWTIKI